MRVIFPLMVAIGLQEDRRPWFHPVGMDAITLHVTAFATEVFMDRVLRRKSNTANPGAMLHLQKGLRLLRESLMTGDADTKVSDSTISIVLKLTSAAYFDGDYQASSQ